MKHFKVDDQGRLVDTGCKCNDCARMYFEPRWLKWANSRTWPPKEPQPEYPR